MDTHSHIDTHARQQQLFTGQLQPQTPAPQSRKRLMLMTLALVGSASLMFAALSATSSQDPRGKPVSITSESTPFGMSLFRLWSNGDIEVMVLGQDNVWSDWKAVASGKGGYAPGGKPGE